jgi:uncharacterized LabA/DUF88 family protein
MYYSAKNLYNAKVNFEEILKTALNGRQLIRAIAYAIKADVKDEKNFHDALENIGFEVKTKDLLVFYGGHKKGDWDVGIAMDGVRAAEKSDVIVVISGDGDFRDLYEYVRGKGCRIEVMAFGKTASSQIKDYVDLFIDMDKNKKYLIPLKPHYDSNKQQAKGPIVVQQKFQANNDVPINNKIMEINLQQPEMPIMPKVNASEKAPVINPLNSAQKAKEDYSKEKKEEKVEHHHAEHPKEEKSAEKKDDSDKSKKQGIFKRIMKKMQK